MSEGATGTTRTRRTPGPAELLARELDRAQVKADDLHVEWVRANDRAHDINALCRKVWAGEMEAENALRQARGKGETGDTNKP